MLGRAVYNPQRGRPAGKRKSPADKSGLRPNSAGSSRVPSSQFMFRDSLQNGPHPEINFLEKESPVIKRIAFTIPGAMLPTER